MNRAMHDWTNLCVCVRACVRAGGRACVRAGGRAGMRVCACVCVFVILNLNVSPIYITIVI